MELLKEKRFWAAFGLGLALCALVPLGVITWKPGHDAFLSWLLGLSASEIAVLIALVTGIRLRPRRPEPLAAWVGALLTGIVLLTTRGGILSLIANIAQYLLGGRPWQEIVERITEQFGSIITILKFSAPSFISSTASFALTFAVICWLAANYWRIGSWEKFRRGPGGAILKGGIIAGLIVLPISFILDWYQLTVLLPQYIKQLTVAGKHFTPQSFHPYHFSWVWLLVSELRGIISGAVIAAILAPLRPKPGLGAFAGGGLVLGMAALSYLLPRLSGQPLSIPPVFAGVYILRALSRGLSGAIAGSFAGRWSDIEIAKEE
jgi:hypothetical protein